MRMFALRTCHYALSFRNLVMTTHIKLNLVVNLVLFML
jgi:hypothetical protein